MLVLIFNVFLSSCFFISLDNIEPYNKAYEYISADTLVLREAFKREIQNEIPIKVCVRDELIKFCNTCFAHDIVEYEYANSDSVSKRNLLDSLIHSDYSHFRNKINN